MMLSGSSVIELSNLFKEVNKIANKAEGLFNENVSLNDVIKTGNISRNFLTDF